jgi:hypothetical protein
LENAVLVFVLGLSGTYIVLYGHYGPAKTTPQIFWGV